MKISRFLFLAVLMTLAAAAPQAAHAQETPEGVPTGHDTLASALINEFDKEYDIVFKVVKEAIEGLGYKVNYASKKRNLVESDFKVLVNEEEGGDFVDMMTTYGEIPYMRSPGWTVGRAKVTVNFEQLANGKVSVKVLALLSGYEARFTNLWHYWRSNGKIEQEVMDVIIASVEKTATASKE